MENSIQSSMCQDPRMYCRGCCGCVVVWLCGKCGEKRQSPEYILTLTRSVPPNFRTPTSLTSRSYSFHEKLLGIPRHRATSVPGIDLPFIWESISLESYPYVGENAERDVLKTLRSLVSATNDALIYKMRSTRKPHPNPHESILVLSAATSQSIQSTAIICGPMNRSTTRRRSLQSGDSITIPNIDAIVQTDSTVLYSVKRTDPGWKQRYCPSPILRVKEP